MKRNNKKTLLTFAAGATLFGAFPIATTAHAQGQTMEQVVGEADQAAIANNWEAAYPIYVKAATRKDAGRFGVAMAYVWFRAGQGAQILARQAGKPGDEAALAKQAELYKEAIKAYNVCASMGEAGENPNKNRVIYYVGQCSLALEDYQGALDSFAKFRADFNDRNQEERFILLGPGKGRLNLETTNAFVKLEEPELDKGEAGLTWLLDIQNKSKYKIPDTALVATFEEYCKAITRKVVQARKDKDTAAADDLENRLISFMVKNRGLIKLPAFQMYALTPNLLKLSIDMRKLEMHKAAFTVQSFLPNTAEAKEEMELKVDQMGGLERVIDEFEIVEGPIIQKHMSKLDENVEKGEPHEVVQMIVMAQNFDEEDNALAAFAIYEMIELYHNDHPRREDLLFQLVYSSSRIGAILKTAKYGQQFLDLFPSSEHVPAVEELMLSSLFANREFEKCITIANKILPKLSPGTAQHDIALYCLGGSHYYLGQFLEASKPLADHVKTYGSDGKSKSDYIMATSYWDGSNDSYLLNYKGAAIKLDKFLKKFPKNLQENPYYPEALYDRANCHAQLEEYEPSNKLLNIVCKDYLNHHVVDRAFLLRGNNNANLKEFQSAYDDYKRALELAKKLEHVGVEEETLHSLVALLARKDQKDKAIEAQNYKFAEAYYDEFWAKFSKGQFRTFVAVSGIPALYANNRADEALENLKQVIVELAAIKGAPGMDKAINSYTQKYLEAEGKTIVMLRDHYNTDFPFDDKAYYARSLVKMSLVGVYNELAEASKDDAPNSNKWKIAARGQIDEVSKFPINELNNYTLVFVGNAIRENAATNEQFGVSVKFYKQAIKRVKDGIEDSFKNEAIFGLAQALAQVGDTASIKQAIAQLEGLRKDPLSGSKTVSKALFSLMELSAKSNDSGSAIKYGTEFLDKFAQSSKKVQVRMALGHAYLAQGNSEEASLQFQSVIIANASLLKYAGPALLNVVKIEEPKSVVSAYQAVSSYVKLTQKNFDKAQESGKMSPDNSKVWDRIKEINVDFRSRSEVKDYIEEEKKQAEAKKKALG